MSISVGRLIVLLTLALAVGVVAGWFARAGATPAPPPIDVTAETVALLETDRAFARMSREKGPAVAFAIFLLDDALSLPAASDPVTGKESIAQRLAAEPTTTLFWEPREAVVAKSGDLGYTWGTFESRSTGADGKPSVSKGKYANVWRRDRDGQWRVALDIGNSSPGP